MSKSTDPDPANPNPPAEPPKSTAIVRKTKLQTPKELELEKRVKAMETSHSKMEDRLDGFDGALKDLNDWLEGVFPDGKTRPTRPEPRKGLLDDLEQDVFGGG